jgi:maltooligosyltrehalose trehalohydrolase
MNEPGRFGPRLEPGGGVTFRLWAPAARGVELILGNARTAMAAVADGWFELTAPEARPGDFYRFRIDDEIDVPDPASAFQPQDAHGPSEVIDHDYAWQTSNWRGRPWHEAVVLELHVGCFTPAGSFRGVIGRLDDLVRAGITAIELMPVADFPGRWNWGYDGVLIYAPDSSYGRPAELKALIDAAHQRGLMVLLDVVYNHFGPDGNYLARYAPGFFSAAHDTPWGAAIDYRVPQVRAFAIGNALHWLSCYRFDGLRLDAVHAIVEPGEPSLLEDLSSAVGAFAAASGRKIHLVLENDDNCASLLDPLTDPPAGKYRAQWNDDYHHAWHVLLSGETGGYYGDYQPPGPLLAKVLSSGFGYQGEQSGYRNNARRGESSKHLPNTAFVNFLQNHDQIGNRARGERLTALAPARALEAALAVTLLAPMPPLLFMGEEWGANEPFPFFCDFGGELAEAVRRGRRTEFAAAYANLSARDPPPDALAESTFRAAMLDWTARKLPPHRDRLNLVTRLLTARHAHLSPRLAGGQQLNAHAEWDNGLLTARWLLGDGSTLILAANLTGDDRPRPSAALTGRSIWGGDMGARLPPWSVFWLLGGA